MEERVSGGAIIQHISKLRQRLEATGKDVPPPPRRGGGYGNSNSKGRNTGLGTPVALTPANLRRTRASANMGSNMKASETEEEMIDIAGGSESQEEFGNGKPKAEKADDTGAKQEDQSGAGNAGEKRKRVGSFDNPPKRSKGPAARKPHKRKNKKTNHLGSLSVSSGEDDGSGDENPESDDDKYQQDLVGRQYLAVGADFFQDYDQDDASTAHASSCGGSNVANRVVVLRFGESERAKALLQHVQSQDKAAQGTDAESVVSSSTTSIARFDGGRESIVHGGEASPNIADPDYHSMSLGNSSHLSQEYNQRLQQVSLPNPSGGFVVSSSYSSIALGNDSLPSGNNAIYNSSVISDQNYEASGDWSFQSMPANMTSSNVAGPLGYSAHMSQQQNPRVFGSSNIHSNSFIYQSSHANNLGQESGWSAPLAFDHRSEIIPRPAYVAPTEVIRSHTRTNPVLYENAFSRSRASSGGCAQQVQGSAVINSASSAETPIGTFPAVNSFLPDNNSAIQVPGFEISEDVYWADFLDDLHGIDDVFNTNLMANIPNEGDGGTEAED